MNKIRDYVSAVLERASKTTAQAAVLEIGAETVASGKFDVLHAHWLTILGFAGGGFVLSVLTSIASSSIGDNGPSLTSETVVDPKNVNDIPDDPAA
jgi:hypothetical protein